MDADQLRELEHRRLRALVERRLDDAGPMHADDYQLITPGGEALSKDGYMDALRTGDLVYRAFDPGPVAVRFYGNAAVLRYRCEIDAVRTGHAFGRAPYWHTDVWERGHAGWQVVWSQATAIQE